MSPPTGWRLAALRRRHTNPPIPALRISSPPAASPAIIGVDTGAFVFCWLAPGGFPNWFDAVVVADILTDGVLVGCA